MSSSPVHYNLADLPALQAFAVHIAARLMVGDALCLEGDLGAGKTTFTRALIAALAGTPQEVPSPTFTLVQQYALPQFTLYHFDLYRLKSNDELIELGLEQALAEGVTVIEWPELARPYLRAQQVLTVRFSFGPEPSARVLELSGPARFLSPA